jgi:hypothetical protein
MRHRQGKPFHRVASGRRASLLALALVGLGMLAGWRSLAGTVVWTNTAGGSWLEAKNWDPNRVPTVSDTAVITNSGTYTVTLDAGAAIAGITVGAASGAGTQTLAWSGGTFSDCTVTIGVRGALNLTGAGVKALLRCTVKNAGTITWSDTGSLIGAVDGYSQSVLITNLAGGLFNIQTDAPIGISDPGYGFAAFVLHNAGTLRKSAGTGINSFATPLAFINQGTVELQQGGLQFPNGFSSSGTFNLASNTVVNLDGGTFTFGPASLKTGAGELLLDGGDIAVNGTLPGLSWTGGRVVGSSFTLAASALMAVSGPGNKAFLRSTFNNAGTVTWTGSGQLIGSVDYYNQTVLITNLAGGLFEIQNDSTFGYTDPGYGVAAYVFHNAGTLRKSAGAGTTTFATQATVVNTGSILIEQGTMVFPGFQSSGSLAVQPGAAASFPLGFVNNGTFNLASNGVAISTGGACSFGPVSQLIGAGQWIIPSGDVTLTGIIPSLSWTGGRLVGSTFTVASNAVLSVSGAASKVLLRSKLSNAGTITWTGAGQLVGTMDYYNQAVLITNLASGLFDIQTDATIGYSDPGYGMLYVFHNAGTLRKSAGIGTNTFDSHLAVVNAGTITLQQGGLTFPNGFDSSGTFNLASNTVVNLDGGTFTFGPASLKTGAGQLLVDSGDVALNGTLPGLSWMGGRLVGSSFTVAANAVLAISGPANKAFVRSTINNAGTVVWTGTGQLIGATDGYNQSLLIANLPGGVFDIQNDSAFGYSDAGHGVLAYQFINAGTLRKSAGTGTTTFANQCAFLNAGGIVVEQGTIQFAGFQNDGGLTVQAGATVTFPLGFVNNGIFLLNGDAVANSTGGACSFGPSSLLAGSGHWIVPSGDITLTGLIPSLSWTGGRLVGSTFTVASNAVLSLSGTASKTLLRSKLSNAGTITWTGSGHLIGMMDGYNQAVLITNLAGGLFDIQTDSNIGYSESGHGMLYVLHNAGTLRKSAGTGVNTFDSHLAMVNSGTIALQQGGLAFPNGFNSSGAFSLAANTVVNLDGGTFTFGASSLKTGAGQLVVDGGDLTLKGTVPGLSWTGGRLVGSSFTVAANAVMGIGGAADKAFTRSTINNAGTITWTGTGQLVGAVDGYNQTMVLANLAGGLFDIQNDSSFGYSDGGYGCIAYQFINAGTLRKSAGVGTNSFPSQCAFINSGRVELPAGALLVNSSYTQTGSGTLALQNLNPVAPLPRLSVTGLAVLDGVLELSVLPNLAAAGQSFTVMTYGTRAGLFSSTQGSQLSGGLWLRPAFTPHELMLAVENAPKFFTPQMTGGGFRLQWQGAPGVTCRLDASTNLVNWLPLFSTNSPDGFGAYLDADSLVMPRRFYRLTPQ